MNLKRTYISATSGKGFAAPTLNAEDLQHFARLVAQAKTAAKNYDGSSYRRFAFLDTAHQIAKFADRSPDLIAAYAHQTNPHNHAHFSLDDLYLEARARLRGPQDQPSAFGTLLENIKTYEGIVEKKAKPFEGERPMAIGAVYQPRLATVIDVLCEERRGLEELRVITPPYKMAQELHDRYVIVAPKHSSLKIAVCDNIYKPTYILDSKAENINALPRVATIDPSEYEDFTQQLYKALSHTPQTPPNLHLLSGGLYVMPAQEEADKPLRRRSKLAL